MANLSGKNPLLALDLLQKSLEKKLEKIHTNNLQLKRKIFDLYTIFEISKNLSSLLEIETLLEATLLTCHNQLGSEGAALILKLNPDEEKLQVKSQNINFPENLEFSLNSRIMDILTSKNKPVFTKELELVVPAANPELKVLQQTKVVLSVPLVVKEQTLGILVLTGKTKTENYSPDDLEFLAALVNQLTAALENAHLYEKLKEANLELQKAQELLVQHEKLAALGKFAASVAHEVNNPLGIIKNYLLLLSQSGPKGKTRTEYLKIVQEEIERITKILNQLLSFYKTETEFRMEPTDVGKVLEETLKFVEPQIKEKKLNLITKIEHHLPLIKASAEELRQVFLNLLVNARDFTPKGGKIEVKAFVQNKGIKIEFADSGSGIPDENMDKIFEPFFTTKNGKGAGLGLSVCYGIIERHKGTIFAENIKEGGSRFLIYLPLSQDDQQK
ncbi:MAG TPA: ATP-binding protein [candidate division Zixibacteria bacterium]|nr:ATP-binding protein [candidate division Zixibacteria bacterium]